jgi:hypothetical protein
MPSFTPHDPPEAHLCASLSASYLLAGCPLPLSLVTFGEAKFKVQSRRMKSPTYPLAEALLRGCLVSCVGGGWAELGCTCSSGICTCCRLYVGCCLITSL